MGLVPEYFVEDELVVTRLGANLNSIRVQTELARSTDTANRISERLSSGSRVNRPSDDAAGLAISASLRAQTRIQGQAIRNLNDGISTTSIAEGALDQLGSILGRIEELATQSMNGTFSTNQRTVMQQEVTQLQAEWNRIVESTTYNGRQLLTGTSSQMVLQGGRGNSSTVTLQVGKEALSGGFDDAAGATTRVNTSSAGVAANNNSNITAISADGQYVAFYSDATNLVASDTNAVTDVFVKHVASGTITRVSTSSAGVQANGIATGAAMSNNGRYVAFYSGATNLVAGDSNGAQDAFVKDTVTGTTTRVSTSSSGAEANNTSTVTGMSADGRYVLFHSTATNLVAGDTNGVSDVFVKDTLTGVTTRVSTTSAGAEVSGASTSAAISADGRYVVFNSAATTLVSGDTNSAQDVFVKDTLTGVTTRVSSTSAGVQGNNTSTGTAISADGRYIGFYSDATNLVTGDTNAAQDAFIKDTSTGETTRVSTSSSGTEGNGGSNVTSISADGRYVGFWSYATNLVTGDTNGAVDTFVKDISSGTTTRVSVSNAGVQGDLGSSDSVLSADGRYITFHSNGTNLVSGDTNGSTDIFVRDLSKMGIQTLAGMVVNNQVSAGMTADLIQGYRNELTQHRANLGAMSSRIEAQLSAVSDAKLNVTEASSRMTDADIATEGAQLAATRIRQQVGSSLLAQANLAPQLVLDLLRAVPRLS